MSIRPEQPEPFLRGCVFPAVTDAPYPRADPAGAEYLPADVWSAAQLPVGVRLELVGNAQTIRVWYETTRASLGYRGESAGCSFVAYRAGQKVATDDAEMGEGMAELVMSGRTELPVTIYLPEGMAPLITGVAGVEEPMVPAPLQPRWLAYGDAVTQGWLASAPAMAWPAVAGRKLGLDVCNLGYAGSARGETTSALLLAETPAEVISIAFGLNNWSRVPHTAPLMAEEVRCFLSLVRKSHPEIPIVVVSPTARPDAEETPNRVGATLSELRRAMEETVRASITEGDSMLFLVEGLTVVDPEHLEDGIYPGDEGHRRLAAAVSKILLPHLSDLQAAAEKRWANEGVHQTFLSPRRSDDIGWAGSAAGELADFGGVAGFGGADLSSGDVALAFEPPDIAFPDGYPLGEESVGALLDETLLGEVPPDGGLLDGLAPDEMWQDEDEVWPDDALEDESPVMDIESEMDIESVADFGSVDESSVGADWDDGLPVDEVVVDEAPVDEVPMSVDPSRMESLDLALLSRTSLNEALLDALSSNEVSPAAPEIESPEFEAPGIELVDGGSPNEAPVGRSTPAIVPPDGVTGEAASAFSLSGDDDAADADAWGTRPDIASLYNEQLEFTSLFDDLPEPEGPEIATSNGSDDPDRPSPVDVGGPSPSAEGASSEGRVPNITPAEGSPNGTAGKGKSANGKSASGKSANGASAKGASANGRSASARTANGRPSSDVPPEVQAPTRTAADSGDPTTVARKSAGPHGAPVDISIADMVVAALTIATNGADDVIVRNPVADDVPEWAEAADPGS